MMTDRLNSPIALNVRSCHCSNPQLTLINDNRTMATLSAPKVRNTEAWNRFSAEIEHVTRTMPFQLVEGCLHRRFEPWTIGKHDSEPPEGYLRSPRRDRVVTELCPLKQQTPDFDKHFGSFVLTLDQGHQSSSSLVFDLRGATSIMFSRPCLLFRRTDRIPSIFNSLLIPRPLFVDTHSQ